jgi:hypothetical protein
MILPKSLLALSLVASAGIAGAAELPNDVKSIPVSFIWFLEYGMYR